MDSLGQTHINSYTTIVYLSTTVFKQIIQILLGNRIIVGYTLGMSKIDKIKYLCKRYQINAALANALLSALDYQNQFTVEQLEIVCNENETTNYEVKYFD